MTKWLPPTTLGWPKELLLALLVGLTLGYAVGWSHYSALLGFKYGSISALIYFAVRLWQRKWTVVTLTVLVLATILFGNLYSSPEQDISQEIIRPVPKLIEKHLQMWHFGAEFHRLSYFFLATIATVLSGIIVIDIPRFRKYHRWLALAAAVSFGIISTFDLGNKANQFRNGWRHLNTAVMRYQLDSTYTVKQLIDAYYEGEQTIGTVKPNPR